MFWHTSGVIFRISGTLEHTAAHSIVPLVSPLRARHRRHEHAVVYWILVSPGSDSFVEPLKSTQTCVEGRSSASSSSLSAASVSVCPSPVCRVLSRGFMFRALRSDNKSLCAVSQYLAVSR